MLTSYLLAPVIYLDGIVPNELLNQAYSTPSVPLKSTILTITWRWCCSADLLPTLGSYGWIRTSLLLVCAELSRCLCVGGLAVVHPSSCRFSSFFLCFPHTPHFSQHTKVRSGVIREAAHNNDLYLIWCSVSSSVFICSLLFGKS